MVYFGARYYDPDTGRFITQDSYLGESTTPPSLHRYLYAYSNPTVYIDLYGYRPATPEEEAELALREEAAERYQSSYEEKGILGKMWDRFYGADHQKASILENLNKRQMAAIESAADGEAVIAVPNPVWNIEVNINLGDGITKVANSEYLTESQVRVLQQISDIEAAKNGLPAAVAYGLGAEHSTIQIVDAATDIVLNTAIAMHSRASNPSIRMTIESRSNSTAKTKPAPNTNKKVNKVPRNNQLKKSRNPFKRFSEWYKKNQAIRQKYQDIKKLVDPAIEVVAKSGGTLKEKAEAAFNTRKNFKQQQRDKMENKKEVRWLERRDKRNKIDTFDNIVQDKMKRKGLNLDEAYQDVINSATKTNPWYNIFFGVK